MFFMGVPWVFFLPTDPILLIDCFMISKCSCMHAFYLSHLGPVVRFQSQHIFIRLTLFSKFPKNYLSYISVIRKKIKVLLFQLELLVFIDYKSQQCCPSLDIVKLACPFLKIKKKVGCNMCLSYTIKSSKLEERLNKYKRT